MQKTLEYPSNRKSAVSCKNINIVFFILATILTYFVMEVLCHRGFANAFSYLTSSPLTFFYNVMIVFIPVSLVFLCKRRAFAVTLVLTVWVLFAVANLMISSSRVTPFTYMDFSLLVNQISDIVYYVSTLGIILIVVLLISLVVGFVFLFRKLPKLQTYSQISYKKVLICIGGYLVAFIFMTAVAVKTEVVQTVFPNITLAYGENGFPYSFFANALNRGIHRPSGYNADNIRSLINKEEPTQPTETPNIIMLQLESFFDPKYVKDWQLSENPIPTFTKLKDEYSSGFLTVPGFGMGTVNTEFEVMTGMSVNFFGTGEYPYKTVLENSTVQSMPYILRDMDYKTHAIHNNDATFYNRHLRFPNLGFDTFTPIEFMNITENTPNNWAKDKFLIDEIIKDLDSSDEKDYVYTISVQGHGVYPTELIDSEQIISLSCSEPEENRCAYQYYVNQINEMDSFVNELIEKLSSREEKTMLVLYGDHLPTFEFDDSDLTDMSIYQTEYVIWDNFGLEQEDKDLFAYQLTANAAEKISINAGITTYFHQNFSEDKDYLHKLKLLQYDMIYGEQYAYGGYEPYSLAPEPVEMRYDVEDIKIDTIDIEDYGFYVHGSNFTEYSRVLVNGELQETKYLTKDKLFVGDIKLEESDDLQIAQIKKGSSSAILWLSNN